MRNLISCLRFNLFDPIQQQAILQTKDSNISSWLSALPLASSQIYLSAQEFRNDIALQYKKPPLSLPSVCDGSGAKFHIQYALDCCFVGLVTRRHNEVLRWFWSPCFFGMESCY